MPAAAVAASLPAELADDLGQLWRRGEPLEPAIRSLLFDAPRFEQHGRSLAAVHEVLPGDRGAGFFPRLAQNAEVLRSARALLERHVDDGLQLGPGAIRLLDDAALIEHQFETIRRELPRSCFRYLPRLRDQPLAGLPRIYSVAWAWVAHTDSRLDPPLLGTYLGAYQATRELTLGELRALPGTLRVVLLENLRRLAERAALVQAARDAAHRWIDADGTQRSLASLGPLDAAFQARGAAEPFRLQLQQRQDELPIGIGHELALWLAARLPDAGAAALRQQHESDADHRSIENATSSLREIDHLDWRTLFAATNGAMRVLGSLPVHAAERDDAQEASLRAVEQLAREAGCTEQRVAEALLELAAELPAPDAPQAAPGHWLVGPGESQLRRALGLRAPLWPTRHSAAGRRSAALAYSAALLLPTALAVAALAGQVDGPLWLVLALGALLLFPISEAVVAVVNRLISETRRPAALPRLALDNGIGAAQRTLVVLPALLTHPDAIAVLAAQLEQHATANPELAVQFALLSDWPDAASETTAADESLLDSARAAVEDLNRRHPAPDGAPLRFLLLHRGRRWSESERRWIGWERKRGQLEQLVRLLADGAAAESPFLPLGPIAEPAPGVRHLVTLDTDTTLPPGGLRALVGVAAHPLNRPRLDEHGRVVGGYTILQPRLETPLPAPDTATWFHSLFAGESGIDPYRAASAEVCQDLFGEGTFSGNGLLDVAAARATLVNRLPEAQLLSHDLLEGAIARCASIGDITLVQEAPVLPDVAHARLHRWTRGDWQLLPFVARPRRWDLTPVGRWKMVDNLRRSLVAPMSLLLLLLVLATGALPFGASLLCVAAAFGAGPLLGALAGLAPRRRDISLRVFFRAGGAQLLRALGIAAWQLAQLLQLALLQADAIGRALHRQFVSRRRLLEWPGAAEAREPGSHALGALLQRHWRVPAAALVAGGVLWLAFDGELALSGHGVAALFACWGASPVWTWLAARRRPLPRGERLDAAGRSWLHGLARDTWRYHEHHVGADDHHLPPDSVQHVPQRIVTQRTSPDSIGLYLLATASAQALGFIGREEMVERLTATLDTLERLPRHRGHFLAQYDTRTLEPVAPARVSSAASGSLCVQLVAVGAACEALAAAAPTRAPAERALQRSAQRLRPLRARLADSTALQALARLCADDEVSWPRDAAELTARRAQVQRAQEEFAALQLGLSGPSDEGSMWLLHDHVATLGSALRDLAADASASPQRLRWLGERCRRLALGADFSLLFDGTRQLLRSSCRVDGKPDTDGHHQLLAGEARLASLFGIAKGDLPVAHWAALGRPLFARDGRIGLKSALGSMSEYLEPALLLEEPIGSLLHRAGRSAIAVQQADALVHRMPWGVSASAIAGADAAQAGLARAHGVGRLAWRRLPADESVVAPYASMLALPVAPADAVANLRRLQELGARHALGFIDALDYTPQRQVHGSERVPVEVFLARHQALSLVALCDVLSDGLPRRWAMSDPLLRAVRPLLHERVPREVPLMPDRPTPSAPRRQRHARLVHEADPLAPTLPATQLLTGGRHAVMLRDSGAGFSSWDGIALTHWHDDLPRDEHGLCFYLQRGEPAAGASWHSLTAHPAPDPAARYRSRIQADRVIADAHWPDLRSRCTTWVDADDECELRQVELCNNGRTELVLTIASYAAMTLEPLGEQPPDPAISKLFVQAHWSAAEQALYLRRKPRRDGERPVHAVHFLAGCDAPLESVRACADRARWLGRYGTPADPRGDGGIDSAPAGAAGFDAPGEAVDTGHDPIASLAVTLRIAPGATVRLTFGLAAADAAGALARRVERYRSADQVARASARSQLSSGIRLRELQFDTDTWTALLHVNTLLTGLVARELPPAPRAADARPARCDRRLLQRHGIDAQRPILLVGLRREQGLALIGVLLRALRLWDSAGLAPELVVLHRESATEASPLLQKLQALQPAASLPADPDLPPGARLHLLREAGLEPDELHTLRTLARLRLQADGRSLAQQLERRRDAFRRDRKRHAAAGLLPVAPLLPPAGASRAAAVAPAHAFDAADGSLRFEVGPAQHPARPWTNLLANPHFACQVSEIGSGHCWSGDDRRHPISGGADDRLGDAPGEWLLLHDLERDRVWPLGRMLSADALREVSHAPGQTRMRQRFDDIEVTLVWCVDPDLALRQLGIELRSHAAAPRRLRLVSMLEWTLCDARGGRLSVATRSAIWVPPGAGEGLPQPAAVRVLQATQNDHGGGHGGATAFVVWRGESDPATGLPPPDVLDDWTCDRSEFFDPAGRVVLPARLGRADGPGLDPCAALGCSVQLAPGNSAQRTLLLGHAASMPAAIALLQQSWATEPAERLRARQQALDEVLGAVRVSTPDPAFDALVNHWLPYQTLAGRLWARGGRPGGPGGTAFRDALQDAAALVNHAPGLLAQQIRSHAAHQFADGDVQRDWHSDGSGVRTRCADERLWLSWACALYLRRSGDLSLLDEPVPFLRADATGEGAAAAGTGDEQASIYEHAARAIDCSLRTGSHGLPLIDGGDWLDGMDQMGRHGNGESVWLAWFLCAVVGAMLPIAAVRGDAARVTAWTAARRGWRTALEAHGWDGQWYRRGFFDDGTPLGSSAGEECRIDLATQSWAVLSGAGDPARAAQALSSAERLLHDRSQRLVRLFDPPLRDAQPGAGSLQAWPPGVGANGGQHNQTAVWALMAFVELRDADAAWRIFSALSPAHRWQDPVLGPAYAVEPHVMADGVCSQPPRVGSGWLPWDTASAGWMLRAAIESICGIALARDTLAVRPCLPPDWSEVGVTIRHHGRSHRLIICADAATLQGALEREEGARRIAIGETLALDRLADASVHLVDATGSAVAARQDQFEQGAFTVARTADE